MRLEEKCDDEGKGGCLPDCSGPEVNYSCTNVNNDTPSVCINTAPAPICGNGILEGNEKCDDGGKGGCKSDCSDEAIGYTCSN